MFETDLTALSTPDLLESAADCAAEAKRIDVRLLEHAQTYADRHHPNTCPTRPHRRPSDGRERAIVLGGDGCPEIAEFAPAEFGAMIGLSAGAAATFIGQALALRHRLPLTWARVQAGEATAWKARKIATACLDLSEDAARSVDQRVAKVVDSLTPIRLDKIVEAAKKHADPDGARRKIEEKARERGVFLGRSDEHGTRKIFIRTAAGNAARFNAHADNIADALKAFGDTRSLQCRRAEAVGIMTDSRFADELIHQARQLQKVNPAPPTATGEGTGDGRHQAAAAAGGAADRAATATTAGSSNQAATGDAERATTTGTGARATPDTTPTRDRSTASASDAATGPSTQPGASAAQAGTNGPPTVSPTASPTASTTGPASARDNASPTGPVRTADRSECPPVDADRGACLGDEDLLGAWGEPVLDDEANRDAPHPSDTDHPDPLDTPFNEIVEPFDPVLRLEPDEGAPLDAQARRALDARLAQIRHDAHTNPGTGRLLRPAQTEIYVHLTDHTLATGTGVLRVEDIGPLIASQLTELVGHGPYTVKPVIDLHDAVSVDAYEIPDRIRERVKLIHPVELFPYGTRETHAAMDLDHIQPYDPLGPPGQTNPANLAPLRRFPHRVKTHGGWQVRRLDYKTLEWITPNGFAFHVDPTGTHRVPKPQRDA